MSLAPSRRGTTPYIRSLPRWPGARRRLHGGAQAERGRPTERVRSGRGRRRGRACQPECSTWSRGPARRSARQSPATGSRHGVVHRLDARREGGSQSWPPATVKRVTLELGGKSATVILPDADLRPGGDRWGRDVLFELGPDLHRPEPDARAPRTVVRGRGDRRGRTAESYAPGNPLEDTTRLGPLVSAAQRDRVRVPHPQRDRRRREARHGRGRRRRRAWRRAFSCARPFSRRSGPT